jgi:tRNA-2-methylthio-N6-dimethylallyladenosine synthase
VLVEGPSKRNDAVWSGRTRQNKLVHFDPAPEMRPGELVTVEITKAADHWLAGALVDRVRPAPRRRIRIPVAVV